MFEILITKNNDLIVPESILNPATLGISLTTLCKSQAASLCAWPSSVWGAVPSFKALSFASAFSAALKLKFPAFGWVASKSLKCQKEQLNKSRNN